ncbi:hypothetical protein LV564_16655 [Komagataeibacter nataicola]|nr:hypothetical protein [Komagataeibacter nataicola]WEQ55668.1 hypothetical protein LV564_16655 [Komagataeibacter nataicola]WNM09465.1 hypothetical protein RI056_05785 [Komagataeibacter nataicola]
MSTDRAAMALLSPSGAMMPVNAPDHPGAAPCKSGDHLAQTWRSV